MARPKKDAAIDLSVTHELSHGLIDRLVCPPGTPKAFLRDSDVTGLKVRVTANGAKSFVFEAKLNGQAISRTLGRVGLMSIPEAQAEARALAVTVKTDKADPRELDRKQAADKAAAIAQAEIEAAAKVTADALMAQADKAASVTVGEVWSVYLVERSPYWGALHLRDHIDKAKPGGLPSGRRGGGKKPTQAGPLAALMPLPLRKLDPAFIEAWAAKEALTRRTSSRLAWNLLKAFLGWCAENPAYAPLLVIANPAKTKKAREAFGKPGVKKDTLLREQLPVWFDTVRQIQNPMIAAALQVMLLTGARPGEVLSLRWDELNTQWKGMTIRDKDEGDRTIPLTPYVWQLLSALPRRNEWVFSSPISASGRLTAPNKPHTCAVAVAGLDGLTLHGLRRSFKSLTEWLEIPAGVVAQLMGHKPSATAEKHYTVRPLDLLRVHHERIEAWILEQARVTFDAKATSGALRMVVR